MPFLKCKLVKAYYVERPLSTLKNPLYIMYRTVDLQVYVTRSFPHSERSIVLLSFLQAVYHINNDLIILSVSQMAPCFPMGSGQKYYTTQGIECHFGCLLVSKHANLTLFFKGERAAGQVYNSLSPCYCLLNSPLTQTMRSKERMDLPRREGMSFYNLLLFFSQLLFLLAEASTNILLFTTGLIVLACVVALYELCRQKWQQYISYVGTGLSCQVQIGCGV